MELTRRHLLLWFGTRLAGAPVALAARWAEIAAETDGVVGAACLHLGSGKLVSLRGEDRFPLASVCKLPIAMHTLAMVDEGRLARRQMIEVLARDVNLEVSEVDHRWPAQRRFPLDELMELMVARSDNTAVETLFRIGGGSPAIMARLRAWRVDGIRIDRTERQCGRDAARDMRGFIADARDTAMPDATVHLLQRLFAGELLSGPSTARMVEMLQATRTGSGRIKGLLPAGTVVAHKTGTTGTAGALNGGTNDVGVIALPNGGGRLALAVYIKGSTRDLGARERVIAHMSRAAYDSARDQLT